MKECTLREFLDLAGVHAYYKDCKIIDINPYSEQYALVEMEIPLPVGGTHKEIVPLGTVVEIKQK